MAGKTPSETRLPQGAEIGRSAAKASKSAFVALLCRDLAVLKKNLKEFIPRTIIQPFLLVFVFLYVFPKIGQGIGGGGPPLLLWVRPHPARGAGARSARP